MNYRKLIFVVGFVFIMTSIYAQAQRDVTQLFRKYDNVSTRLNEVAEDIISLQLNKELLQQVYDENNFEISMTIPVSDEEYLTLQLHKFNILTSDFILRTSSGDTIHNVKHGLFYRGSIEGQEGFATISIFPEEIMGIVSVKGVGNYNLGKLKNSETDYVVYNDMKFKGERSFECHTPDDEVVREVRHDNNNIQNRVDNCIKFYIEGDYALYQDQGGTSGATQYIEAIFAEMATLYDNEEISIEISEIMVWDQDDGYSTTSSQDALNQFVNNNPNYNGDLASLYALGGQGTGGLAYVDVLCSNYGYAYMNINSNYAQVPTYSWTIEVITHETGHNIGSKHTHACVWNGNNTQIDDCGSEAGYAEGSCYDPNNPIIPDAGTIMSYCHLIAGVGIDFNLGFGEQPGDLIRSKYNNAACLTACTGGGSPPVADFEADNVEICENETVYFTDLSTNDPTSWYWTFEGGDPANSDEQDPAVTYYYAGTYDVELEATNNVGSNTILKEDYITVFELAVPDFTYTIVNDNEVHFTNLSNYADYFLWDFDDGTSSSEENPVHIFNSDGYYNVTLYASNYDCDEEQSYSVIIHIVTKPVAHMSMSHTVGCKPDTIHFYDTSSDNVDSRTWTFEGGLPPTSTATNPVIVYNNTGTFDVTLMVFNSLYSDTLIYTDTIYIHDKPHSGFIYTINGNTVSFTNTTVDGDTYNWNYGDGTSSTDTNTVHTYAAGGDYNVRLIAMNECGTDTTIKTLHLTLEPVADFTVDSTKGCSVYQAQFHSLANTQDISWIFQGGSPDTSTQLHPLINYVAPGTYDVTMYATNNLGKDTMVKVDYITVLAPPVGSFTYNVSGYTANFSQNTAAVDTFLWNFGDGTTSTDVNPSHTYNQDGTYTVKFTYSNLCDTLVETKEVTIANPPVADFTFSPEGGCAPLTVQFTDQSTTNAQTFNWSFPGGTPSTSTDKNPSVIYNNKGKYNVTLIASNNVGADTMTMAGIINVDGPPTPAFSFTNTGFNYSFTYTGDNATLVKWKFGDGASATGFNVNHVYLTEGNYTIQIIAQNECGSDTLEKVLAVALKPTASFSFNQKEGCAPLVVEYQNTSSGSASSFLWFFENGTPNTSTLENPIVTYINGGTFDVILIAYGDNGNDTLTMDDLISVDAGPDVDFAYSIDEGTVSFTQQCSEDANVFYWDFDDGTVSDETNPVHTYNASGTYDVTLYAKNDCGEQFVSKKLSVTISGIKEIEIQSVTLFPNPNDGNFFMDINTNKSNEYRLTIHNTNGKIFENKMVKLLAGENKLKFNYNYLPKGLYIINLENGNDSYKLLFNVQ